MTVHCPDCLTELPSTRRRKDGRCDWCRAQVGRRRTYQPTGKRQPVEGFEYLLTGLENGHR